MEPKNPVPKIRKVLRRVNLDHNFTLLEDIIRHNHKNYEPIDPLKNDDDRQTFLDMAYKLWTVLEKTKMSTFTNSKDTTSKVGKVFKGIEEQDLNFSIAKFLIYGFFPKAKTIKPDTYFYLWKGQKLKNFAMKVNTEFKGMKGKKTDTMQLLTQSDVEGKVFGKKVIYYGKCHHETECEKDTSQYKSVLKTKTYDLRIQIQKRVEIGTFPEPIKDIGTHFLAGIANNYGIYSFLKLFLYIQLVAPKVSTGYTTGNTAIYENMKINKKSPLIRLWKSRYENTEREIVADVTKYKSPIVIDEGDQIAYDQYDLLLSVLYNTLILFGPSDLT